MININLDSNNVSLEVGVKNNEENVKKLTPIISKPMEKKEQAKQWAKNKGATKLFIALADVYWELCTDCGGVNPIIAYVQAAIETDYGKFNESLKEELKNPAGLKTFNESDEEVAQEVYAKFTTWLEGVCAHLDHLALYAGATEYPRDNTVDPRHFQYLYGVSKYIEGLESKWSVAQDYGQNIIKYMREIADTTIGEEFTSVIKPSYVISESEVAEKTKNNIEQVKKLLDEAKVQNDNICKMIEVLKICVDELAAENNKLAKENLEINYELEKYKKITNQINKDVSLLNNY